MLRLLLLAGGLMAFSGNTPLSPGAALPAPNVKMKDVSGSMVSFADARQANGLLVMFSCNTCPVVRANQQRTRDIAAYALSHRIGVILLDANEAQRGGSDSYDAMRTYAQGQQYHWYYVVDDHSAMADLFGASHTPECYLFDKGGSLVYSGAIDNNPEDPTAVTRAHLHIAMDEMLAGKPVTTKATRSVGCQIHRLD